MSSVIGWVEEEEEEEETRLNPGMLTQSGIRSARIHSNSGQTWLMMIFILLSFFLFLGVVGEK
jgi:hypothetical protein